MKIMKTSDKTMLDEKLEALASTYANDGYVVLKEPGAEHLPFDLDGYTPDLIATKGNSGLIVEVKTQAARVSVDRFQLIAQEIAKHPGWRFVLVTLDDVDLGMIPTTTVELPTWPQLMGKLKQVDALVENGVLEGALLYLSSIVQAALRLRALDQHIPIERLPSATLLNHMYSQGEVSVSQIDFFRVLMTKSSRIAHGANEVIEPALAHALLDAVRELLADWAEVTTS